MGQGGPEYCSKWYVVLVASSVVMVACGGGEPGSTGTTPAPTFADYAALDAQLPTVGLAPGDRLYLFSDGLYEERDAGGEQFGLDRLMETLSAASGKTLDESLAVALDSLGRWSSGPGLRDDVALIGVERAAT